MVDLDFMEQVTAIYLWKAEQRHRRREYHLLLQEQHLDDGRFQHYFHLSRTQFEDCSALGDESASGTPTTGNSPMQNACPYVLGTAPTDPRRQLTEKFRFFNST
ncbi:hypothetical protein XENOCAPTIV_002042 [Xenoophorus captivus]|uniref:Uncharacterized protein n=1 Tax=Xenoophorus captivus TaxID=1517983 RepID=A0ABV0QPD7_9TELE